MILYRRHLSGFTLIELIIVMAIIGLVFSVSLPVSYNMYLRYKASLEAQEVLIYFSKLRRESFLYGEEKRIHATGGRLIVNDQYHPTGDTFISMGAPITFFSNRTSTEGAITIYADDYTFYLYVEAPLGKITLEE